MVTAFLNNTGTGQFIFVLDTRFVSFEVGPEFFKYCLDDLRASESYMIVFVLIRSLGERDFGRGVYFRAFPLSKFERCVCVCVCVNVRSTNENCMRFNVITAVTVLVMLFWVKAPCGLCCLSSALKMTAARSSETLASTK
jgi:hypothetical protein